MCKTQSLAIGMFWSILVSNCLWCNKMKVVLICALAVAFFSISSGAPASREHGEWKINLPLKQSKIMAILTIYHLFWSLQAAFNNLSERNCSALRDQYKQIRFLKLSGVKRLFVWTFLLRLERPISYVSNYFLFRPFKIPIIVVDLKIKTLLI